MERLWDKHRRGSSMYTNRVSGCIDGFHSQVSACVSIMNRVITLSIQTIDRNRVSLLGDLMHDFTWHDINLQDPRHGLASRLATEALYH
jgi:hypothetical protein